MFSMDVRLSGDDYIEIVHNCHRNHHQKFEIDRTIITSLN